VSQTETGTLRVLFLNAALTHSTCVGPRTNATVPTTQDGDHSDMSISLAQTVLFLTPSPRGGEWDDGLGSNKILAFFFLHGPKTQIQFRFFFHDYGRFLFFLYLALFKTVVKEQ